MLATRPRQQLATLGISRLVFVRAEKVERGYLESGVLRVDRGADLQALLVDGLEQASVATTVPQVLIAKGFKAFFERDARPFVVGALAVALHPGRDGQATVSLLQLVRQYDAPRRVVLLIGPGTECIFFSDACGVRPWIDSVRQLEGG